MVEKTTIYFVVFYVNLSLRKPRIIVCQLITTMQTTTIKKETWKKIVAVIAMLLAIGFQAYPARFNLQLNGLSFMAIIFLAGLLGGYVSILFYKSGYLIAKNLAIIAIFMSPIMVNTGYRDSYNLFFPLFLGSLIVGLIGKKIF